MPAASVQSAARHERIVLSEADATRFLCGLRRRGPGKMQPKWLCMACANPCAVSQFAGDGLRACG